MLKNPSKLAAVAVTAAVAALSLVACSPAPPAAQTETAPPVTITGIVTDSASYRSGSGTTVVVQIQTTDGERVYSCYPLWNPVCALLKPGDHVSFTPGTYQSMDNVKRTKAVDASPTPKR